MCEANHIFTVNRQEVKAFRLQSYYDTTVVDEKMIKIFHWRKEENLPELVRKEETWYATKIKESVVIIALHYYYWSDKWNIALKLNRSHLDISRVCHSLQTLRCLIDEFPSCPLFSPCDLMKTWTCVRNIQQKNKLSSHPQICTDLSILTACWCCRHSCCFLWWRQTEKLSHTILLLKMHWYKWEFGFAVSLPAAGSSFFDWVFS